ncbi:MAG TPA: type VI secretion system-associated FHA domain protein TagH [Acetobacteraceae bacterium]|jgi:type VI secretion system FHA domain protein
MQLIMTVLRCPDAVAPETRNVAGGEFSVGRGPGVDWVLPDPERLLSKRHFVVAFRGGTWQLADTSTNGTFLNREGDPIGAGDVRGLHDGDRLRLGAYEIEVRLVEDAVRPRSAAGSSPFADPFAMDPFGPSRPERNPFDEPDHPSLRIPPTSAQLPHDFDPLAPESPETPFRGPTQADNSPVMQDAFRVTAEPGQMPLHSGGVIPGDDLLPDDWDKDLLEGIAPAGGAPPAPPPQPVARAPAPQPVEPEIVESPFDEPPVAPPPVVATPRPVVTPPPVAIPRPVRAPPPESEAIADDGALLAAFLEGAGLQDAQPKDPPATMLALGKAFRTLVAGLRAVLIARAQIKSEFRIEQTMIQAHGNNPLKFSAGDDDALAALIGTGRRTDMAPHEAVADALRDIRLHELASMAAMQFAVRAVLDGLDPAKLRAQAEQGGAMTVLPAQRKARAWDAYEALHARTVQALADDFDSVFGKAFARAYERSLHEVSAKERL